MLNSKGDKMKKIGYVLLGLVVSIALCVILYYVTSLLIGQPLNNNYLLLAMTITISSCCFLVGSLLSGYLAQPYMKQRSFFSYLLISPGVYFSLADLVGLILILPEYLTKYKSRILCYSEDKILVNEILFVIMLLAILLVWIIASYIGTRIGIFLRDKRIKQADKNAPI